jgi:hypothetical protein
MPPAHRLKPFVLLLLASFAPGSAQAASRTIRTQTVRVSGLGASPVTMVAARPSGARFAAGGSVVAAFAANEDTAAPLANSPALVGGADMAADPSGGVVVANQATDQVVGVDAGGGIRVALAYPSPTGIAISQSGLLLAGDHGTRVTQYASDGSVVFDRTVLGVRQAASGLDGTSWVSGDVGGARLYRFDAAGNVGGLPFNRGSRPGDFGNAGATGLAVDSMGRVWLADPDNGRVQVLDRLTGGPVSVCGPGLGLSRPVDVAVAGDGDVLIADANRVVVLRGEALQTLPCDTTSPRIANLRTTTLPRRLARGQSARVRTIFVLSEKSSVTIIIRRTVNSRVSRHVWTHRVRLNQGPASVRLPSLKSGQYSVEILASDAAGNEASRAFRLRLPGSGK